MSQKYPVGIETFSNIIEGDYAYIDKTEVIYRLISSGKFFFLSRPRRFGKSLMLSTIQAYFEGRKELFENLWLGQAEGIEWTPHPVLRLNFISAKTCEEDVEVVIDRHLSHWEAEYGICDIKNSLGQRFFNVIKKAYEVSGQKVVVLIDEYDKVLVNSMHDEFKHRAMKNILKPVYSVLKDADGFLELGLITGVSRFSKLSIFSDLNNLRDISMTDEFSTLCGITEVELKEGFREGVENFALIKDISFDAAVAILKDNYDGYHFSEKCPDIYNPFSLINSLAEGKILHRWFESGTPTFLLEHICESEKDLRELLSPEISEHMLANTSISDTNLTSILYQTGYLTIKSYDAEEDVFKLGIPNKEVATGIFENLLPYLNGRDVVVNDNILRKLRRYIMRGEVEEFVKTLQSFFAGIPQHLSDGKHEIYYENNLYVVLRLLGFDIITEQQTSDGRIDAVLKTPKNIFVIELKLNGTAEDAIAQIKNKNYALQYNIDNRKVVCIGIGFSKVTRTINNWIIE